MNNHIYSQLISLNKNDTDHYLKRYVKMVSFYKQRNWSYKFGLHEHHILPESFGGPDSKENLVFITPREHFILHWMLYKAFPQSSMTTTFKSMCCGWGHMDFKVTSKVYQNVMLEFIERQRENARERNKKRVLEGKHNWQGDGEQQRERAKKRVTDGTNPFCGGEIQRKRLENGTHTSQIKKMCPHCNKTINISNFAQWHGDNCKLNPLYKPKKHKPHTPQIKIECEHCKREFDIRNFSRWHGDKCKLKPM